MTHTANEAPLGQESVQLTVTLVFYPSLQTQLLSAHTCQNGSVQRPTVVLTQIV